MVHKSRLSAKTPWRIPSTVWFHRSHYNFRGPVVGAAVLIAISESLCFAAIPDAVAASLRLLLYGLLLVVMVHLRPQSLAGEYRVQ